MSTEIPDNVSTVVDGLEPLDDAHIDTNSHSDHDHADHDHAYHGRSRVRRPIDPIVLAILVVMVLLARGRIDFLANDDVRLWATLFVSICFQALPFLVLGVVSAG